MSGTKKAGAKSGGKAGARTGAKKSAGGRGNQGAAPPSREERRAGRMQETGGVAEPKASAGEITRFHKRYIDEVRAKLTEEFGYKNPMQVPRLEKIVINMGVGEATGDQKKLDAAVAEMTLIAAQKPVKTVAKKAIEMEHEGKTIQEIGPIVAGAKGRVVYETGDMEHGVWSAGTVMGLIQDIPTCKELVERIVRDAEEMIRGRLSKAIAA